MSSAFVIIAPLASDVAVAATDKARLARPRAKIVPFRFFMLFSPLMQDFPRMALAADSIGKPIIESMINALRQARKVTLTREE